MASENQTQDSQPTVHRNIPPLEVTGSGTMREQAGYITITHTHGEEWVWAETEDTYATPVRIRLRARTNWKNISLKYAADCAVNFNDQSRTDAVVEVHEQRRGKWHVVRGAELTRDEWHDLVWEIGTDTMRVLADGRLLYSTQDDYAALSSTVAVGTIEGTTVDVAELVIEPFTEPTPSTAPPWHIREPIRGKTVLLEGLTPNPSFYQGGAMAAALSYFGVDADEAWVMGGCGAAFVAVHMPRDGGICASATNTWKWRETWKHLRDNVGCKITTTQAGAKTYDTDRPARWRAVREAIDAGYPVTAFDIGASCADNFICGYDDAGNYLYLTGSGRMFRHPHDRLGRIMMGDTCVSVYQPSEPAPDRTVVRDALSFAVESPTGKHSAAGKIAGAEAYDVWIAAMDDPAELQRSGDAASEHAEHWSECRRMALEFLEEAKRRLDDRTLDPLFDDAIVHYTEVADSLADVRQLFSFASDGHRDRRIAEPDRRRRAAQALTAARDADAKGVEALAKILAALK